MSINPGAVAENLSGLIAELRQLLRQEFALANAETDEKIREARAGTRSIVIAIVAGLTATIMLAQALVIALARVMPPWLSAATVAAVLGIVALIAMRHGEQRLSPRNLVPRRMVRSLGRAAGSMKEVVE